MTLIETLRRMRPPVYAVLDGALVEDVPSLLAKADLPSRALYAGEFERIGIRLLALKDMGEVERLLRLFPEGVPAVFWSWSEEEERLYRHLRGIGKVEVPKSGTNPNDPEFEAVVFRHADPASLMKVLPVLTEPQRAMFFGPSPGVIFRYRGRRGPEVVRVASDGRILRDPEMSEGATAAPAGSVSA